MMQFGVLLFLISACLASFEDVGRIEEEGYYKREHSLVQPYHGKTFMLSFVVPQVSMVS